MVCKRKQQTFCGCPEMIGNEDWKRLPFVQKIQAERGSHGAGEVAKGRFKLAIGAIVLKAAVLMEQFKAMLADTLRHLLHIVAQQPMVEQPVVFDLYWAGTIIGIL